MHGHPSLRDRLRQQTAAEIEEAAFALFAERGYEAAKVEQIAAAAGVSTRTFFRYFPSKEAVVFADHARGVERLRAALAEASPAVPPMERVRRAMIAAERPGGDERRARQAELAAAVPALRAHHARLIEDMEDVVAAALAPEFGGEAGYWRARIVAGALFGALRGAMRVGAESKVDGWTLFQEVFALLGPIDAVIASNRWAAPRPGDEAR